MFAKRIERKKPDFYLEMQAWTVSIAKRRNYDKKDKLYKEKPNGSRMFSRNFKAQSALWGRDAKRPNRTGLLRSKTDPVLVVGLNCQSESGVLDRSRPVQ